MEWSTPSAGRIDPFVRRPSPCWCARRAAVLVELGFLSNAAELKKLKTTAHQDLLAGGIAQAIRSFLKGQQPRP